ncbi:MAG: leucyl aminopeptidase [Brockia lithotrophica]|nr:leucyl aminopeptidase [Brockia lithotrophica]
MHIELGTWEGNDPLVVKGDALVALHFGEAFSPAIRRIDEALGGALADAWTRKLAYRRRGEDVVLTVSTLGRIPVRHVMLVGTPEAPERSRLRTLFARGVREAQAVGARDLVFWVEALYEAGFPPDRVAEWLATSAYLSQYRFDEFRSEDVPRPAVESARIAPGSAGAEEGLRRGRILGEAVNFARDLVQTPPNVLTPEAFCARAVEAAKEVGLRYAVLKREDMESLGMGALLAVARGSANEPRLVVLEYTGEPEWKAPLTFVGKGITFDTGGISLKPAQGMESMVRDMAGAATALAAILAAARLGVRRNLMAVLPMVENMPDGKAYRPGDVIRTMSGKTVEVISTDAEGRLVLADAITYARGRGAGEIVDVATLTGAVLVALGTETTGVMANDEELYARFAEAAAEEDERIWRLPAFDVYLERIRGRIADLKNSGGRNAGTITAGMFLKQFADPLPWLHLDIAGTAWDDEGSPLVPKGPTGVMVRTLVRLAFREAREV